MSEHLRPRGWPAIILAILGAALLTPWGRRRIADDQLLAYARTPYDRRLMEGRRVDLGDHDGKRLVAEFPCSDLCPAYTVRIIRYDLVALDQCAAQGGRRREIDTPLGTGYLPVSYCIPQVVDDHWDGAEQWR